MEDEDDATSLRGITNGSEEASSSRGDGGSHLIGSSRGMAVSMRCLNVEVVRARKLPGKNSNGLSSPYCVLSLDGKIGRTSTKLDTLHPEWGETFHFHIPYSESIATNSQKAEEQLEIAIYSDTSPSPPSPRPSSSHSSPSSSPPVNRYKKRLASTPEGEEACVLLGTVRLAVNVLTPTAGGKPEAVEWHSLERRSILSRRRGELGIRMWFSEPLPSASLGQQELSSHQLPEEGSGYCDIAPRSQAGIRHRKDIWRRQSSNKLLAASNNWSRTDATLATSSSLSSASSLPLPQIAHSASSPPPTLSPSSSFTRLKAGMRRLSLLKDGEEITEVLFVQVIRARSLLGLNARGSSDPYVTVNLGAVSARTPTVHKDLQPEWNRVFAFMRTGADFIPEHTAPLLASSAAAETARANQEEPFLDVLVWDENFLTRAGFLGGVRILLRDVAFRDPGDPPCQPEWFRLERRHAKYGVKGEIQLAVWFGKRSDENFSSAWQSDSSTIPQFRSRQYSSPPLWYLRVQPIAAEGISHDRNFPNLVVRMRLGANQRLQSDVASNRELRPEWDETQQFVLLVTDIESAVLEMDLVDLSSALEEVIGTTRLAVSQIRMRTSDSPIPARWLQLERISRTLAFTSTVAIPSASLPSPRSPSFSGHLKARIVLEGGHHVIDEPPNFLSSTLPSSEKLLGDPIGMLELGVLEASISDRSLLLRGDIYAVAKYGRTWVRTRTIPDDFQPKWKERFVWPVYDLNTVLTIALFDNKFKSFTVAKDVPIGKVRIRLSSLDSNLLHSNMHPLLLLTKSGIKKTGEVHLSIRVACDSMPSVVLSYSLPELPRMHYLDPIPERQLDSLRQLAVEAVAAELAAKEPPLRGEVVSFMAETDDDSFSMRRVKANMNRIKAVFAALKPLVLWLAAIKDWQDTRTTLIVHFVYALALFFPSLILPAILIAIAARSCFLYQQRPQAPPVLDLKLSQGEQSGVQEEGDMAEEEMEESNMGSGREAASSNPVKYYKVLKGRYERLKEVAVQVQTVMGRVATVCERIEFMLSWRDPRATAIVTAGCIIATIVLLIVPFRPLALVVGWWQLRHPKLRRKVPPRGRNFFNRLPSLADAIY